MIAVSSYDPKIISMRTRNNTGRAINKIRNAIFLILKGVTLLRRDSGEIVVSQGQGILKV